MDPLDPRPSHDRPHDRGPAPARLDEPDEADEAGPSLSDGATPEIDAAVISLLAAAGGPSDEADLTDAEVMPPDVADRIMVAIADAARLRVDPGPLTTTERGATVTPFVARPNRRTPWMAVAAVAAAVAVIAVGGSALHLNKRPNGAAALNDTTTSASITTPQPTPRLGAVHIQTSDTPYAAGNLADRARTLLTSPGPQLDTATAASAGPVATPAGLTSCLTGLKIGEASDVSVDLATFDGSPAAILVVTNDRESNAWVVARTCTAADPAVIKTATAVP
ncbi:hypothetical protein BA895_11425 [Humibacillus sp. DSM 29435]|uniref:hypothetical protein n=1 Tax=Humibacillus sp. DSM 29435 TaxID=1869167 RepID=UPI000872114E|nr:hypothetical protein [Humibacillus sp. DSM 29435]OFE14219.1 hypothetical protein BA895_11425 [Humibacillus sp. DSM 29435]